ncbi:unnamed protein product [Protopolystoma xenopodis]|uniref:Uncharacterized protein n=1 Tax=Protopolystoma xenopodis TaxID=117903 RepID=A0A448X802_9PLAT|nr:unnamed protein product [Protopolystoma xenopodis]
MGGVSGLSRGRCGFEDRTGPAEKGIFFSYQRIQLSVESHRLSSVELTSRGTDWPELDLRAQLGTEE